MSAIFSSLNRRCHLAITVRVQQLSDGHMAKAFSRRNSSRRPERPCTFRQGSNQVGKNNGRAVAGLNNSLSGMRSMKALLMTVAMVGMLCSGSVVADFTGGNALLAQCQGVLPYVTGDQIKGGPSVAEGMCVGLVEGVLKTMQSLNSHLSSEFKTCFPERPVTVGEAVQIVVDYLRTTELKDTDDATLAMFAIQDAYPCK